MREYLVTWGPSTTPVNIVKHQYYLSWTPTQGKRFVLNGIVVDHWVCELDVEPIKMVRVDCVGEPGAPMKVKVVGPIYPELWNEFFRDGRIIPGSKVKHWAKDHRHGYCVVRGGVVVAAIELDNGLAFVSG